MDYRSFLKLKFFDKSPFNATWVSSVIMGVNVGIAKEFPYFFWVNAGVNSVDGTYLPYSKIIAGYKLVQNDLHYEDA